MKVQCGQCPAKYAIADERIHGKKVRIRCKRCGAAIVVDGKLEPPQVTTEAAPQGSDSLPPSDPRPEAKTILGGLEAPTHLFDRKALQSPPPRLERPGMPAPGRGFTEPPPAFNGKAALWRVAMTENDLRWMTTPDVLDAYRAGVVKPETFVLGEGMSHWQTLLEVGELAGALGYELAAGSNGKHEDPPSVPPPRKPSTGKRPALRDLDDGPDRNVKMTKLGLGLDLKPKVPGPLQSDVEASPVRGKTPARLDESFLTLPFTDAESIDSLPPPAPRGQSPEATPPTPQPVRVEAVAAAPLPSPFGAPRPPPPAALQPLPEALPLTEPPTFGATKAGSGSLWPWLLAVVLVAAVVAAVVVFTR
jgi:predicted Zn finger-like uncharacterized protein